MIRGQPRTDVVNPFRRTAEPEARPAESAPPRRAAPVTDLPLRPMTGFEEEFVEEHAADANTARLANDLLARCLVAPGEDGGRERVRVATLLVAERDAALVALRRMSLGDHVESEVDCPHCGASNGVSFDLAELPVAVEATERRLALTLPDGRPAELRLPTAGDQEALLDAGVEGAAARVTWLIARLLERLGDAVGPFDEATARALPITARQAIEDAIAAATPDLDLSMAATCAACGEPFAAPFDVASFFLLR
jgi:hypothetical protein